MNNDRSNEIMANSTYDIAYRITMAVDNQLNDYMLKCVVDELDSTHVHYDINAKKIAQAVKKSIPSKPELFSNETVCPDCGKVVEKPLCSEVTFCEKCGKAIDWR